VTYGGRSGVAEDPDAIPEACDRRKLLHYIELYGTASRRTRELEERELLHSPTSVD